MDTLEKVLFLIWKVLPSSASLEVEIIIGGGGQKNRFYCTHKKRANRKLGSQICCY